MTVTLTAGWIATLLVIWVAGIALCGLAVVWFLGSPDQKSTRRSKAERDALARAHNRVTGPRVLP